MAGIFFVFVPLVNTNDHQNINRNIAFAQEKGGAETALPIYKNIQTFTILSAARNIDPNPSRGGGGITIIDDSALVSEDGPEGTGVDIISKKPSSDQITLYVVREGDTLSTIADMFEISPNTLRWANNLNKGGNIRPGDSLIILPMDGLRHIVHKGDTIASVAKMYQADAEEILMFNDLTTDTVLQKDSVVIIPGGEMPAPKIAKKTVGSSSKITANGLIRPVSGAVRTQGIHGYNAVDLAASVGTTVRAAAAGKVILSRAGGWNGGYGNYIVIDHGNGTQTLYSHLSANSVGAGEYVAQGQTIGAIGSTGRSTGPHLHFEVRGAKNPF